MKKALGALLFILLALACVTAACGEEKSATELVGIRMDLSPTKVQAGDEISVTIRVTNLSDADFTDKLRLFDPDGEQIQDFPRPVLKVGESVEWTGTWKVTEEQAEIGKINYSVYFVYKGEDGQDHKKIVHFYKRIRVAGGSAADTQKEPDARPTAEPTPEPDPEPTPRPEDRPRIILYSTLKPNPDNGKIGLCCIDAAGDLWCAEEADLQAPYSEEEILQVLLERRGMKLADNLDGRRPGSLSPVGDWLRDLAEMAEETRPGNGNPVSTGADTGENAIYAVKYGTEGKPEPVLLGVCGSAVYENKDPNAQALYQVMWRLQPLYAPCGYAEEGLTPHGFEPVGVREFFGLEKVDAATAVIRKRMTDCEEGFIDMEMTKQDREKTLALLDRGVIVGKANPWEVTGGTMCYCFYGAQGEYMGCIETYEDDGLAVGKDGMYTLSLLPESTDTLPEEEQKLLHLKIEGVDYELGKSTPRDLIRNGWYCYIETDGCFAFTDDGGYGDFYVYTRGGSVDEPMLAISCQFAYTIRFEYCGFDGIVDPENPEDTDTIWRIRILGELKDEIEKNGYDPDDYRLTIDPFEGDDEDERGDGEYWEGLEEWMLTLGGEEAETDNGTRVRVKLSDGHTLSLFTAASPVSLTLTDANDIQLGPEEEE